MIGKRREEQVFAAPDGQHLDQVLGGDLVHPAALEARVDERVDTDGGDQAGPAGGDLPEQHGDHALREAVGLDLVLQGERAQRRHQGPVPADDPPDHALVREVVHPARLAVALAGGEDQREVPGCAGGQEALFQGEGELLGEAGADEAGGGQVSPSSTTSAAASAVMILFRFIAPARRRSRPSWPVPGHGTTSARPMISPRSRAW